MSFTDTKKFLLKDIHCGLGKWSSRLAHNQEINGSNPLPATMELFVPKGKHCEIEQRPARQAHNL